MKEINYHKVFRFVVRSPIVTKARPRARVIKGKFAQVYTPETTKNYENLIKTCYLEQCNNHYFGDKPIIVNIEARFGKSKELEKYGKDTDFIPCTTHKDCDNIAKIILDALNGVAYKDDKQVWDLEVEKLYNDSTYDEVCVSIAQGGVCLDDIKDRLHRQKELNKFKALLDKTKLTKAEKEKLKEYLKVYNTDDEEKEKAKRLLNE